MDLDQSSLLGPGKDSEDAFIELAGRFEEEPSLLGADGDLEETTSFGYKTQFSHTHCRRPSRLCSPEKQRIKPEFCPNTISNKVPDTLKRAL